MFVYRIVKSKTRTADLSGTGAFNEGGRWNNEGVFALYTSENEALAMLEVLVHLNESEIPPSLYVIKIAFPDTAPIFHIPDKSLPDDWRIPGNTALQEMGDKILGRKKHLGFRARSAVMPGSYNYILNPLYPDYGKIVTVKTVKLLAVDKRFPSSH